MAGSVEGERAVAGSGERELSPLHSLDYPCTARHRLRRLFAYLRGHGNGELYLAARRIMPVIFHTKDMTKKVREGQWREAMFYVNGFAHVFKSGPEARLLNLFLQDFVLLDAFADSGRVVVRSNFYDWLKRIDKKPVLDRYPCFAALVDDILSRRKDHTRAFFDWQLVRNKGAKVAEEMAYKTPELRDKMRYPRGRNNLYHAMPIGSRRPVKKNVGRKQSADLAQFYLQMNKRLPSSSQGADSELAVDRGETLIALFEASLEAGRRSVADGRPPKRLPKESAPFLWAKAKAAGTPFMVDYPWSLGPVPFPSSLEALFGLGTSRRSSVASAAPYSAIKRAIPQESHQGTAHPENDSKRLRTTGSFGEDPSSSSKGPHTLAINEGTE